MENLNTFMDNFDLNMDTNMGSYESEAFKNFPAYMAVYQKTLRRQGIGRPKADVLGGNIIDVSKTIRSRSKLYPPKLEFSGMNCLLLPPSAIKDGRMALTDYRADAGKFANVPCFEKGAVKMTNTRYIAWETQSVDEETGDVTVSVEDYRDYLDAGWGLYCSAIVSFFNTPYVIDGKGMQARPVSGGSSIPVAGLRENKSGVYDLPTMKVVSATGFFELMDTAPREELFAVHPKAERVWLSAILSWAVFSINLFAPEGRKYPYDPGRIIHDYFSGAPVFKETSMTEGFTLGICFHEYIGMLNAMLASKKAGRGRKPQKTYTPTATTADAEPDARRIRVVGDISVTSSKVPRMPSEETIRHYHVASWNVRGHTRTYKNGKQIYVKPCVRHRKTFGEDVSPQPTTLVVKP